MSRSDPHLHLSPNQQSLVVAALASNKPSTLNNPPADNTLPKSTEKNMDRQDSAMENGHHNTANRYSNLTEHTTMTPGQFLTADDSLYLDFDPDADGEDQYEFDGNEQLVDDFPGDASQVDLSDLHDKRKTMDDDEEDDEGGGKRRESEGGTGKKPGRKPLTAEPTSVSTTCALSSSSNRKQKRKAQNRAAQRAFRERKEKHLKGLETKVEDLEKTLETTNHENGLLRAQVDRLQIEKKEYRKRLSWISTSGQGGSPSLASSASGTAARRSLNTNQNDFQFEFPRFGDLPPNHVFNKSDSNNNSNNYPARSSTLPSKMNNFAVPEVVGRSAMPSSSPTMPAPSYGSTGNSPLNASSTSPPVRSNQPFASNSGFDSLGGLFSPSILEASRQPSSGYFPQHSANNSYQASRKNSDQNSPGTNSRYSGNTSVSNTDSPTSSYESQQNGSSMGTSPEPSLNSPGQKVTDYGLNTISEENQPQYNLGGKPPLCGKLENPIPCMM